MLSTLSRSDPLYVADTNHIKKYLTHTHSYFAWPKTQIPIKMSTWWQQFVKNTWFICPKKKPQELMRWCDEEMKAGETLYTNKIKSASPAALMVTGVSWENGAVFETCRHTTHVMNARQSMKNGTYSYTHNNWQIGGVAGREGGRCMRLASI